AFGFIEEREDLLAVASERWREARRRVGRGERREEERQVTVPLPDPSGRRGPGRPVADAPGVESPRGFECGLVRSSGRHVPTAGAGTSPAPADHATRAAERSSYPAAARYGFASSRLFRWSFWWSSLIG